MPDTADAYRLEIGEGATKVLGDLSKDPALKTLRDAAKEKGWTQGQFNERIGQTIDILAEKGLLQANFDPAAELAKLGDTGKARQQEVTVFADSLKTRGDITDEEYGELMSLVPTAAGVSLMEKLRKMATPDGTIPPGGGGATNTDALKAEAAAMRRDPKYDTDPVWKGEADRKFMAAWSQG